MNHHAPAIGNLERRIHHAEGDPYLSIERARPSIDQIHGARLYEVPGGHAPLAHRRPLRGRTDHNPLTLRNRPTAHSDAERGHSLNGSMGCRGGDSSMRKRGCGMCRCGPRRPL
jgi:hypothetical protein